MSSDLDDVFGRLARSSFRRRSRLRVAEKDYLERRGLDTVMSHGEIDIDHSADPAADLPAVVQGERGYSCFRR
jgi:hypothetical protein